MQKVLAFSGVLAMAAMLTAQQDDVKHAAAHRTRPQLTKVAFPRPGGSAAAPVPPGTTHAEGEIIPPPAANGTRPRTIASVSVSAAEDRVAAPAQVSLVEVTGAEVLASAGTWGDLPRYLQTAPGVLGGSDVENAFFVRGGNSFENLFTVDRFEVPNLNHVALPSSTGGLASMLDSELIGTVDLHTGDIASSFTSRMSSLTEIRTVEAEGSARTAFDLGYSGAGVRLYRPVAANGTLVLSARESITNLFLRDVGLNGSPEFTNLFARYSADLSSRDRVRVETIGGRDRLAVRPTWLDLHETNAFNTDYGGWRDTSGLLWQHTLRNQAVSTWLVGNSEDVQNLRQKSQSDPVLSTWDSLQNLRDLPFFFQQNGHGGATQMKYEYQYADENGSGSDFGIDLHQNRSHQDTAQSGAIFSPYSGSSQPQPAFTSLSNFSVFDRAGFFDLNGALQRRMFLRAGGRLQWLGKPNAGCSATSLLPHGSVSVLTTSWLSLRAAYSSSAQLPPFAILGGAPGNTALGAIHSRQVVVGGSVQLGRLFSLGVEGYRKTYTDYPVSTQYAQLSLATLAPVIDEPITALPMRSGGLGVSRGVELSVTQRPFRHLFSTANLSFARARFTGLDGVFRAGSNDLPIVLNVVGGIQLGRYGLTLRETMTSGRPYTPALLQQSFEQNRMIYDLSRLNALRGPLYNRLDVALNRQFLWRNRPLRLHVGAMNLLNRDNFYAYQWRPRCACGPVAQNSIGFHPDLNLSYTF